MKINFTIPLIISFFSFYSFINRQSISDYEYELYRLINEFKEGVSNDDEFEELLNKFRKFEYDIEDFDEEENTVESAFLLKKAEALTSLVGELSPDGRNFNLTVKKYELAAPILELSAYKHKHPDDGVYCLPVAHYFLWNDSYQALLIINKTSNLIRYNSKTIRAKEVVTGNVSTSTRNAGVDCYSIGKIDGYFTTRKGVIVCTELECESTPHCSSKY